MEDDTKLLMAMFLGFFGLVALGIVATFLEGERASHAFEVCTQKHTPAECKVAQP